MPTVHLLDYVAGNVRSLANAIEKVGYSILWVKRPEDIEEAEVRCISIHFPKPQDNLVEISITRELNGIL